MIINLIKADNVMCNECKSFDGSFILQKDSKETIYLCCNCDYSFLIQSQDKYKTNINNTLW